MTEEVDKDTSCVVYFCPDPDHEIDQLFRRAAPPPEAAPADSESPSLAHIHQNVSILLDEDQGNYDQVYVGSHAEKCLEQIETLANSVPIVVLVESGREFDETKKKAALRFLDALSADVKGAHYQHPVLTFGLVSVTSLPDSEHFLSAAMTAEYLGAGAIDMVKSPFTPTGLNRIIGHAKGLKKPAAHILGTTMPRNLVESICNSSAPAITNHRPDLFLSSDRKAAVEAAVSGWRFPAHDFNMDELSYGALFMLEHVLQNPELEQFRLPRPQLMTFLHATRRQYKHEREVHYHNWRHAVDVTQSLYCFLCDVHLCPPGDPPRPMRKPMNDLERLLSPMHALILIVSAIGHDVGHPGVNNAFLVACNHPLAQMYNDKSVLENFHCAAYSQLLRRHWPALGQTAQFRSTMISVILATDMQRHFDFMGQLGELQGRLDRSDPELANWNDKEKENARELMMSLLIKAADISNVARPFDVSAQWARTLMTEFSRQGELESELGVPTCLFGGPPDKEDVIAAAQSQKGFMSLFGFPLFRGISDVMPNVSCTLPELEKNQIVWDQKIEDETRLRASRSRDGPGLSPTSLEADEDRVPIQAPAPNRESEPQAVPVGSPCGPSTPTRRQPIVDNQSSPTRHSPSDVRQSLTYGLSSVDEKRSSAPFLGVGPNIIAFPANNSASSRRSSKDVALTQLHELSTWAQHNFQPGSRRGSAVDATWSVRHQSHPASRRGSKDESLTTILVTSQSPPSQRSVPPSPDKPSKPAGPTKDTGTNETPGLPQKSLSGATRASIPSSRSHATSSATAVSDQHSSSTRPSSLASKDDDPTPPAHHGSIAATEDPFIMPSDWPNTIDGGHRGPSPEPSPNTPTALPDTEAGKSELPTPGAREEMLDSIEANPRLPPDVPSSRHGLRESRSRSRLRGLKFWKRKRENWSMDGEPSSP